MIERRSEQVRSIHWLRIGCEPVVRGRDSGHRLTSLFFQYPPGRAHVGGGIPRRGADILSKRRGLRTSGGPACAPLASRSALLEAVLYTQSLMYVVSVWESRCEFNYSSKLMY
jgi:hypothetical protein